MKHRILLVVVLALVSLSSGMVWAGRGFSSSQFAYPGYEAQWEKGVGVPDGTKTQLGLRLEKVEAAATDPADGSAGVGAVIRPVNGITINELGFDIRRNDELGFCGPVFPRYRVIASDGALYHFPCQSGVHFASPDDPANWTRIRFRAADAQPATPTQPPLLFGVTTIDYLALGFRLDVGVGAIHLDNLALNGVLLGKSGGGNR